MRMCLVNSLRASLSTIVLRPLSSATQPTRLCTRHMSSHSRTYEVRARTRVLHLMTARQDAIAALNSLQTNAETLRRIREGKLAPERNIDETIDFLQRINISVYRYDVHVHVHVHVCRVVSSCVAVRSPASARHPHRGHQGFDSDRLMHHLPLAKSPEVLQLIIHQSNMSGLLLTHHAGQGQHGRVLREHPATPRQAHGLLQVGRATLDFKHCGVLPIPLRGHSRQGKTLCVGGVSCVILPLIHKQDSSLLSNDAW